MSHIWIPDIHLWFSFILGQFIDKPYRAFFNTCQTCGFKKQAQLCKYIHCNQSLTSKIFCSEVGEFYSLAFGEQFNIICFAYFCMFIVLTIFNYILLCL